MSMSHSNSDEAKNLPSTKASDAGAASINTLLASAKNNEKLEKQASQAFIKSLLVSSKKKEAEAAQRKLERERKKEEKLKKEKLEKEKKKEEKLEKERKKKKN